MANPRVRIVLEDDSRDHAVWVTVIPVRYPDATGAIEAAGQAVARFIANLAKDEEATRSVSRWLNGEDILYGQNR